MRPSGWFSSESDDEVGAAVFFLVLAAPALARGVAFLGVAAAAFLTGVEVVLAAPETFFFFQLYRRFSTAL
jgi:hypothetical protein